MVWEEMSFEEFQDGLCGSHLGYRNGMILAFLNLCVTVMLPIKFWPNLSYGLGDVVWKIWISERNNFSNSESLCRSDASLKVSAQSDMVWEEMSFEEFQDGRHGGHLGYRNGTRLAILNLCVTVMPPIQFSLNPTCGLGADVVWRISRWPQCRPSWTSERNDFSNFESLCHCDASNQVSAQSDLGFGSRCRLKNFKMAVMTAILI